MGLQIRTYVDGNQEFIDLYGNENIDIEISFAEIQDITKKNSAFTKEFKVPGTKNNNNIFNYFFDINAVALSWNPKRKFEADLLYDGYELYNGYVRMNAVTINKLETIYSVTFYSAVGDLASNIGDKGLCEVDTSSLNHSLYRTIIASTILYDPSLQDMRAVEPSTNFYQETYGPISAGDVQYIIGQRGYDYTGTTFGTIRDIDTFQSPLLDFSGVTGFFDNRSTPVIPPYLIPSIRTKKLYELIVNQAGYQIDSDFFETDYFKRYYLPLSFNTDSVFMAQSKDWYLNAINTSGTTNLGGYKFFQVYDSNTSIVGPRQVFKSREIIEDNLGFNPIDVNDYGPNEGIDGPVGLSQVQDYVFAIPLSYSTTQKLEVTVDWTFTGTTGGFLTQGGVIYLDGFWGYFSGSNLFDGITYSTNPIDVDDFTTSGTLTFTADTSSLQVYNQTVFMYVSFTQDLPELVINRVQVQSVDLQRQLPFTIELYKEMSCEFKQIEFIQNINRTFNLVVVEHPVKPKTLIIEPIVNYIGKGRLLDWTDKVDYDSPQTLRPTTSLINGSIFLANKQDKDFVNTQYNTKSNRIFGQNIIDLGVDYKNATTNLVQTLGQNTDYYLNASGTTNFALPCYFISKESNVNGRTVFEYRPFRSLPRQVFKSVPLLSGNTGQRGYFQRIFGTSYDPSIANWTYNPNGLELVNSVQNVNRLTTYPFLISGFSHYTIYDASNAFTPDELIYPEADTMYDRYYRDYIDDLTSEENKIYSCKMQLNPWDVSQLYFDETILIKNAKFRINKISNLSLTDDNSLSDVELVKLTLDYTPTPTLFFDFVSCDDPCDIIHSNTDINYLLWAFGLPTITSTGTTTGKIVSIYPRLTGVPNEVPKKYKVVQSEYNPNYDYQSVFFQFGNAYVNSGFTSYVMYNSCSATTLSSTLDTVSSLTGITSSGCLTVDVTNTGYSRSTFYFTNCSGSTSSWTLDPSETISVCGLWGTFTGTNYQFCPDFTNAVCIETPLPTPTPTVTPGLSPTPTPSVTPTHTTTATLTPTPSTTPLFQCFIAKTINVTTAGWLKYTTCEGVTQYEYKAVGNHQINICIREGSLLPGIPFAQLAVFTETSGGVPC